MTFLGQFDSSTLVWVLAAIQVSGLISAWLARLSIGFRHQNYCQMLFFVLLATVGATTAASLFLMSNFTWMGCGTTLCLMVLTAIWDFGTAG